MHTQTHTHDIILYRQFNDNIHCLTVTISTQRSTQWFPYIRSAAEPRRVHMSQDIQVSVLQTAKVSWTSEVKMRLSVACWCSHKEARSLTGWWIQGFLVESWGTPENIWSTDCWCCFVLVFWRKWRDLESVCFICSEHCMEICCYIACQPWQAMTLNSKCTSEQISKIQNWNELSALRFFPPKVSKKNHNPPISINWFTGL